MTIAIGLAWHQKFGQASTGNCMVVLDVMERLEAE